MKLIQAIIQPYKLDEVQRALNQFEVRGLTVTEAQGFGRQKGRAIEYRGARASSEFVPKLKLEIVVTDAQQSQVEELLARTARTGNVGDGRIFVYPLDLVTRIRTGEKGDAAV